MGCFDHVRWSVACPNCGSEVSGFQTKNSSCQFDTVEIHEINNFYSSCKKCHAWIEYKRNVIVPAPQQTIKQESCELLERILSCHAMDMQIGILDSINEYLKKYNPDIKEVYNNFTMNISQCGTIENDLKE